MWSKPKVCTDLRAPPRAPLNPFLIAAYIPLACRWMDHILGLHPSQTPHRRRLRLRNCSPAPRHPLHPANDRHGNFH